VLLWGRLNAVTLLSGIVVGYLVSVIFPMPAIPFSGRFRPVGMIRLVVRLLADLVPASLAIVGYALRPHLELRPGIVRVDLTSRSDLVQFGTAAIVSLVPGTIVVEAPRRERRLYLHVFDLPDEAAVERERRAALIAERTVLRALGTDEEIARSEAAIQNLGASA
jgi:multicomponent Na+:H+ antiporter subunit E